MPAAGYCAAQCAASARMHEAGWDIAGLSLRWLGRGLRQFSARPSQRRCRLLSWHQICRQCSAVLRKPFLLSLRQFSARREATLAPRAASEHPHQCQLALVCCTAVQLLEQLACGPSGRGHAPQARGLRSFFGRGSVV